MKLEEIEQAVYQHPLPWSVRECWTKDCWCAVIVDANDKGDDSLESCVITAGNVSIPVANLIVMSVNERYGF